MLTSVVLATAVAAATAHAGHGRGDAHHGGRAHALAHTHTHHAPGALPPILATPVAMDKVALAPGSRWAQQRARNADYLLSMNATDLLCEYTSAANLTGTWGRPTCQKKDENGYFGHYMGHYVSATAQLCNATGAADVCARNAEVVARLAEAQNAWVATGLPEYQPGYLFPYSYGAWATLFGPPSRNCAPVCVPYYILHKMLAGMLDAHVLAGNAQALQVALKMAGWVKRTVEAVLASGGQALWQSVLETEWGGMNDALFSLYGLTGDVQWLMTAYFFNHFSWTAPLAVNIDDLSGNHANTHIPEVVGDARGFELTGNATKHSIADNFFEILTTAHSWATGGSNDGEHWGDPHRLGDSLNSDTEESCTTYNVIKVARHEFAWTANASYFDFYERALYNGLIGNQATTGPFGPATHTSGFIYMLPLGGGGLQKLWGASNEGLPCCWGTLSETFAKLSDSIWWQSADSSTLYVNLFVASTATFGNGATIAQSSEYPYAAARTTRLTVAPGPGEDAFTVAVRVPFWATNGNAISINGQAWPGPIIPSSYALLTRTWAAGDVVDVLFTPSLRFEQLDDDRKQWRGVGAIFWGGIMLAALSSSDHLPLNTSALGAILSRSAPPPMGDYTSLNFTAHSPECGNVSLVPLMDITFERYATYLHTSGEGSGSTGFNASGFSVLPGGPDGFLTSGGASVTPNGGDENIRSGDPGETNLVTWALGVQDATHSVTGLSLSYQYVSGYGGDGAAGGSTFAIVALSAGPCGSSSGDVLRTIYTSPVLSHFPFDRCNDCYSPPIVVNVPAGSFALNVSSGVSIAFIFMNNERNVQLKLPIDATIFW